MRHTPSGQHLGTAQFSHQNNQNKLVTDALHTAIMPATHAISS